MSHTSNQRTVTYRKSIRPRTTQLYPKQHRMDKLAFQYGWKEASKRCRTKPCWFRNTQLAFFSTYRVFDSADVDCFFLSFWFRPESNVKNKEQRLELDCGVGYSEHMIRRFLGIRVKLWVKGAFWLKKLKQIKILTIDTGWRSEKVREKDCDA